MKKVAIWTAVLSGITFVVTWLIVGLQILDGDYEIQTAVGLAVVFLLILFISVAYLRLSRRCYYCGRLLHLYGKYCPYCGKKYEEDEP